MKLIFEGASGFVTGSRTRLKHRKTIGLVDCGLYQGPWEIRKKNWEAIKNIQELQFVLLTHAHIDHAGLLPKLVKEGFNKPIHCTEGTRDLLKIMLLDAAFLQEEDARYANKTKHSHYDPALPLYTTEDAEKAIRLLESHPYDQWIALSEEISFKFIRAGHILGSAFLQVSAKTEKGGKIITFSGDLGNGRSKVIKGPKGLLETDYLILESTYGDRTQSKKDTTEELGSIINKVTARGGTLVVPAFAVGRAQEILYAIQELKIQNKIKDIPVYLDSPMAQDATEIYKKYPEELMLKYEPETDRLESSLCCANFRITKSPDDSMLLSMSQEPKIIISASGMLQGGRILHHLKAKLPDPKNGVLFTGYQVTGSKGYLLKNGLPKIRIHHQEIDVQAEIFAIESLSAHADSTDLVAWVRGIEKKPEQIFLNHGEPQATEALRYRLKYELGLEGVSVANGQEINLPIE